MSTETRNWKPENNVTWAATSSVCLGGCLVLMDFAPVVIERFVSPTVAPATEFAVSPASIIGTALLALGVLTKSRFAAASAFAFVLSGAVAIMFGATLAASSIAMALVTVLAIISAFSNLMATRSLHGNNPAFTRDNDCSFTNEVSFCQ